MVDCNNFYASCERVFDPSLRNKPVVILSNNDGCVIARSQEAKELNIPMGAPEFKYRILFSKQQVIVRSSNYALYGDMSQRVFELLGTMVPETEIYSIDEAFARLGTMSNEKLTEYAKDIRQEILKQTGIPVSIGLAPSKTLSKIANHIAKKDGETKGVYVLRSGEDADMVLRDFPISKIWGIGNGLTIRLNRYGIRNALQLRHMIDNKKWVRKHLSIQGWRTVLELNGFPCLEISKARDSKKAIASSRMFGKPLYDLEPIQEAMASFMTRASEKLRKQHSHASLLQVTLKGDRFADPKRNHIFQASASFKTPLADTSTLISHTIRLTNQIYQPGEKYKKGAVLLTGLLPDSELQMDLFHTLKGSDKLHALSKSMDELNRRYGKQQVGYAATGAFKAEKETNSWAMKREYLSKRYTTQWDELMIAKA